MSFATEPAMIAGIDIHLQGRHDGPDLDWAGDTPDTLSGVHIDSSGHRFLLTGRVTEDQPSRIRQRDVRIVFEC
ncbi:Uncharacterised protein [Mycobacteroides abscessus subsp. abscessus]|nr:Uncharacterised protein [Mycobacteroides abscessus subsp. abscessus]